MTTNKHQPQQVPPWDGRFSRPISRRRFAIGDIHGCNKTLRHMVENVLQLGPDDTLFLLGDYIDRGPDSKGVLDYLIELWSTGYDIRSLMGNHEEMALKAASTSAARDLWYGNWGSLTMLQFGVEAPQDIPGLYLEFMASMPRILTDGDYVFVHAGLDFSRPDPVTDTSPTFILWECDYRVQPDKLYGRTLVCGHTMTPLFEIQASLNKSLICLDNGCWSKGEIGYGNLVAMDLDTRQLFVVKNCE